MDDEVAAGAVGRAGRQGLRAGADTVADLLHEEGRQWRPAGAPVRVNDHDFPSLELGKAIPYGVYDLAANTGWVNVGTDHDTASSLSSRSAAGGTTRAGPPIPAHGGC